MHLPNPAKQRRRTPEPPRRERGLTLIEVLVTMVLLGIGLLGLAGLQLRGMQVNQGSTFRSQAAILAEDLADRMRADADTAATQGYDGQWLAGVGPPTTAAATALNMTADWPFRLATLPAGCAVVDSKNYLPAVKITITWDDTHALRAIDPLAAAANARCAEGTGNGSYVLMTELRAQ